MLKDTSALTLLSQIIDLSLHFYNDPTVDNSAQV